MTSENFPSRQGYTSASTECRIRRNRTPSNEAPDPPLDAERWNCLSRFRSYIHMKEVWGIAKRVIHMDLGRNGVLNDTDDVLWYSNAHLMSLIPRFAAMLPCCRTSSSHPAHSKLSLAQRRMKGEKQQPPSIQTRNNDIRWQLWESYRSALDDRGTRCKATRQSKFKGWIIQASD